jgi:hypothetical protein
MAGLFTELTSNLGDMKRARGSEPWYRLEALDATYQIFRDRSSHLLQIALKAK